MNSERWRQIAELFHAALELAPETQQKFLESACGDDADLRLQVESLLAHREQAGSFLETPALPDPETLSNPRAVVGRQLGPYRILSPLGAGGMGEVYRAHDSKLGRDVAVKMLPPEFAHDPERLARFRREARALATLNHPNIAAIYGLEESNQVDCLVLELVEGETLAECIKRTGPLPIHTALDYARQIAEALEAAHGKGIIHRDLKPANVKVTPEGRVKVLDFGLAKALWGGEDAQDPSVLGTATVLATLAGHILGTPPYMSPEQACGRPVDKRTDIWAFGCLLYELLTGRRAFRGDTLPDTTAAILQHEPPWQVLPAKTPAKIRELLRRCFQKDVGLRMQDIAEARRVIEEVLAPARGVKGWQLIAAVALGLAGIATWLFRTSFLPSQGPRAGQIQSIAVLPLANLSGDPAQDYFADGITEELITDLSQVGSLKVISRTSTIHYRGANKTLPQIARELHVDAVVEGSVLRLGQRVKITAQLIQAATDQHLWAESYQRDARDVLAMEEEVARDIAGKIKVKLTEQEKARLATVHPLDPEAHEAYLKGRFHFTKRTDKDLKMALEYFRQATDREPNFAAAYNGLAFTYFLMSQYSSLPHSEARAKAETAVTKALDMDPSLAEAHSTLATIRDVFDRDWPSAEREYKRAIELSPNSSAAHEMYSGYLAEMGKTSEGIAEAKRAQELDPLSVRANSMVCWKFYFARQYDRAIETARKTLELDSDYMPAHWCAGMSYDGLANFAEALRELHKSVSLAGNTESQAWLAYVYASAGETDKALQILHRLMALSKQQYVSPYQIAEIYTGLGDKDRAFEWWDKVRETGGDFIYLTAWPANDSLRSDRRYRQLVQSIGLPP